MKKSQKTSSSGGGRITEHSKGLGTVTRTMVEKRARELAVINGRPAAQFNQLDIDEARKELQGQTGPAVPEVSDPAVERLTQWDEAPASRGVKIRNQTPEDEQPAAEALVAEGVEEAEHDLMVAATKRRKGGRR